MSRKCDLSPSIGPLGQRQRGLHAGALACAQGQMLPIQLRVESGPNLSYFWGVGEVCGMRAPQLGTITSSSDHFKQTHRDRL